MPLGIWPPRLVHPSLPPRQSPAPGVGYNYGAELGNCAGGSFPRKNGQRYRLHLDFHQLDSSERFRSAHMTSPSPRLGLARVPDLSIEENLALAATSLEALAEGCGRL